MVNRRSDDTFRGARNLQFNRTIRDSLGQRDRIDFYKFRASGQVNFNLALSKLQANASVRLLNSRRAPVAVSNRPGNRAERISITLGSGIYYIQVQFLGRRGTTRYNLRASATPTPVPSPTPVPTPAPTLVRDIYPGTVGSDPNGFTVFNNALYFAADDGTNGNELWRVDGSGTAALVRDIFPGIGSSNPEGFTVFNNALYFQANNFSNGSELWRVDSSGTAALVSDINPALGGGSFAGGSSAPRDFTVFNNALYFTANDGTNGNELWKVDNSGTAALVRVINPSIFGGPTGLTVFNNALYFQADDGTTGIELWKLDSSGTVAQVSDINPGFSSSDPFNFTVFNNALYFRADDGTNGSELWRVDSLGGVARVSDINPGSGSSFPNRFSVFNDALYFYATDGTTGLEMWKVDSNGTVALVRDINPGSGNSNSFTVTDPNNALVFNNALYFSANDGANGAELWKVDSSGTAALVRDITPGSGSSDLRHFTVFNNSLYFSTGLELWKVDSNGTAARVSNINSNSRFVEEDFTEFNNALYFQASRGGGRELWRFSDI